jgi:predicted Zn-dependent peptidase
MIVCGKTMEDVDLTQAEAAIWEELNKIKQQLVSDYELDKVKNKSESAHAFNETSLSQIVGNLAYCDMLGDINLVNTEDELYAKIQTPDIRRVAQSIFDPQHCNTLYYEAIQA